jgi:protein-tyrosine phosphatase
VTFKILTVCTGNICRSPQAEHFLRILLADAAAEVHAKWAQPTISSAGTLAPVGARVPEEAKRAAHGLGDFNFDEHTARQLTKDDVTSADLILTMAKDHRGVVAKLSPLAARRTFTIIEFERIVVRASQSVPTDSKPGAGDFAGWARIASAYRGYYSAGISTQDDVEDPFRRPMGIYEQSAARIMTSARNIVSIIA